MPAADIAARRRALLALAILAALSWSPQAARATAAQQLVVIPRPATANGLSYFSLQMRPHRRALAGSIELRNPTAQPVRVLLAPVDGQTLSTLGSAYRPRGSRAHNSTLWLRLSRRSVRVAPHATAAVTVTVAVPARVKAGDYLSGVSVEALGQTANGPTRRGASIVRAVRRGVSIVSAVRYAIGVEVSLAGRRRRLIRFAGAVARREPAGLVFMLLARNSGNAILQGVHGRVRITRGERTVVSRPIPAGTFLAHTSIAYPIPAFGQQPTAGTRYGVEAWLRYQGGIARLRTSVTFGHRDASLAQSYSPKPPSAGATPWWQVALLAGVLLYGAATTILLFRRRRRDSGPRPSASGGSAARLHAKRP